MFFFLYSNSLLCVQTSIHPSIHKTHPIHGKKRGIAEIVYIINKIKCQKYINTNILIKKYFSYPIFVYFYGILSALA